jgi:hypothetical protein
MSSVRECVSSAAWADAQLAGWDVAAPVAAPVGDPINDWLDSGVPALTGRLGKPPLIPPGAAATAALGCEAAYAALTGGSADRTWHRLLSARAVLIGWQRRGPWSLGGACRAVRCSDGFVVVNLARPEDVESVAAVVEHDRVVDLADDAWQLLDEWAAGMPAGDAAARLQLLCVPGGDIPAPGAWWQDSTAPGGAASRPVVRVDVGEGKVPDAPPLVVDLSSLWAGPLCAKLLGDAGARVVKVEIDGRLDGARQGDAAFYDFLHAGHESVLIDLTAHDDRDLLTRLIADADIVVESSRPRALLSWGIDAHEICDQRPTTWVSITAYGRRFPERVGFGDDVAMATGLAAREGDDDWPLSCGDAIADPLTGMHAAVHALASYQAGRSCVLDVAMAEVVASTIAWCAA